MSNENDRERLYTDGWHEGRDNLWRNDRFGGAYKLENAIQRLGSFAGEVTQIEGEQCEHRIGSIETGPERIEGERWTIYVCENCGQYGFVFGSQHSIPISKCEPDGEHAWEHIGPYRVIEVVPAISLEEAEKERDQLLHIVDKILPPGGRK